MKLIVKDSKLAQKALRTNRDFTVGQVLSGDSSDLEVLYHSCPEAFEVEGGAKSSTLPERNKEVIEKRKDKNLKKIGRYKHKAW